jgi:hypothetical protein
MTSAKVRWLWVLVFCLTLPTAVVLSTNLARRSFERVKLRGQTITVKGYAERSITSDLARWQVGITVRDDDLASGYRTLEAQRAQLTEFLAANGFPAETVGVSPVDISNIYARNEKGERTDQVTGYVLGQDFGVSSPDVGRIAAVAQGASDLIRSGIRLNARSPEYLYTKLDELKLQMLNEASANARERAEQLVSHSTSTLGPLRSASQGVFQITPAFSTDVSDYGVNDTSSIQKAIKAVVTMEYALQD